MELIQKNFCLADHYTQLQVLLSILKDKNIECLNAKTSFEDGKHISTVIDLSLEDFSKFLKGKEIQCSMYHLSHTLLYETCSKTGKSNYISIICTVDFNIKKDFSLTEDLHKHILENGSEGLFSSIMEQ